MAEVKILVEGYTIADSTDEGEEKTRPTITLVQDKNIVMVCDPGTLDSQQILIDALKNEGLTINDVNYVFITHSHIDHYRNIGMFPNAKTLEYWGIWDGERADDWKENYPRLLRGKPKDPYASDLKKLQQSRKKILEMADWIIPGHGGMYKVKSNPL